MTRISIKGELFLLAGISVMAFLSLFTGAIFADVLFPVNSIIHSGLILVGLVVAMLCVWWAMRIKDLIERFEWLSERWKQETDVLSSTTAILENRHAQDIIKMGRFALPLIFLDLERNGGMWFGILYSITKINPVPKQYAGRYLMMKTAWLEWAYKNGYAFLTMKLRT